MKWTHVVVVVAVAACFASFFWSLAWQHVRLADARTAEVGVAVTALDCKPRTVAGSP